MTAKDFEMNASINFIYDGWEFVAHKSKFDEADQNWYLYHDSFSNGEEKLGTVPNPFTEYSQFLVKAEHFAGAWVSKNAS